jgi:hypothetical protein
MSSPPRVLHTVLAATVCIATCLAFAVDAGAATPWRSCSRSSGDRAARSAGLVRALDADRRLRRVFAGTRPSRAYGRPATSLCGDFDGDGHTDRALLYQCCTVSSPAPWLVVRRTGSTWRIAFSRLHDTTFKLEASGTDLVTTEPKYASTDPNCCPSQLRIGTLQWTGTAFRRTFRLASS